MEKLLPRNWFKLKNAKSFFQDFLEIEAISGVLLIVGALIALGWANSPWTESYQSVWATTISFSVGGFTLAKPLILWINDGLMAIFFFVVGMEIKREVLGGELSSLKQAALPIAAAIGGMVLPAMLYVTFNWGEVGLSGWGIPMATDIAFALGILGLLGSRAPLSLKIFLTAVAIVDDLGAVLVIALFYTAKISWLSLGIAGLLFVVLLLMNRFGIRVTGLYLLVGLGLWLAVLKSGVHATVAGVLLAMTIPYTVASPKRKTAESDANHSHHTPHTMLETLEHALHPWVSFVIMPIFALANAGVVLVGDVSFDLAQPITLGIIAGLILGKQGGIMLGVWLAIRAKLATKPADVSWVQYYGVSCLAGIGFTMSLFITGLAFSNPETIAAAKIGILVASAGAGALGWIILYVSGPVTETKKTKQLSKPAQTISH